VFDLKGLSKSKMLMLTVDANELGTHVLPLSCWFRV